MTRIDFVRHLLQNGRELLREGGRHSVYVNRARRTSTAVSRHCEANDFLARKICRDPDVPTP